MINKYQQGGAAPQLGGGILALIQQLPQEQQQQLMQAFAQWAQQKGVDIQQLQSNPQALEQALGQFMQEMQAQQAQAAKHGAKLNYIKKLKHQCAEDEELEFFAKGGVIGCNCVKKNQGGGKTESKKSALQQYKDKKKAVPVKRTKAQQDSINKLSEEDYFNGTADHTKPGTRNIQLKKKECGGKMKKHQIGGTIETLRKSLNLKKDVSKAQYGLKFGGSNKSNRFVSEPYPLQTPEVIVNSSKPYRFDRRQLNLGNGRNVISDVLFKGYENGEYQGDNSDIVAGRTIYQTPKGNDTIYGGYMQGGLGNGQWIENKTGFMPIMQASPNGKANFYRNIKKSFVYPSSSYRNNTEEIQAFQRAKRGN